MEGLLQVLEAMGVLMDFWFKLKKNNLRNISESFRKNSTIASNYRTIEKAPKQSANNL